MDAENEIREAFNKCESLQDLAEAANSLKDKGFNLLLINRVRMNRLKEIRESNVNSYNRIPKVSYNFPEDKEPLSSINADMSLINYPVIAVTGAGVIF